MERRFATVAAWMASGLLVAGASACRAAPVAPEAVPRTRGEILAHLRDAHATCARYEDVGTATTMIGEGPGSLGLVIEFTTEFIRPDGLRYFAHIREGREHRFAFAIERDADGVRVATEDPESFKPASSMGMALAMTMGATGSIAQPLFVTLPLLEAPPDGKGPVLLREHEGDMAMTAMFAGTPCHHVGPNENGTEMWIDATTFLVRQFAFDASIGDTPRRMVFSLDPRLVPGETGPNTANGD